MYILYVDISEILVLIVYTITDAYWGCINAEGAFTMSC